MMGLPDGPKSFRIGLVVLIPYRLWRTPNHPASHVAVAITLNAKASSLKTGAKLQVDLQVDLTQNDRGRLKTYRVDCGFLALIFSFVDLGAPALGPLRRLTAGFIANLALVGEETSVPNAINNNLVEINCRMYFWQSLWGPCSVQTEPAFVRHCGWIIVCLRRLEMSCLIRFWV